MNLFKNASVYVVGELISKLMPFLLLPYFTHSLGLEGFGELSLFQAWITFAVIFVSYAQEAAIVRSLYYYGKHTLSLVVATGYLYSLIVSFTLSIFALAIDSYFAFLVVVSSLSHTVVKIELTVRQSHQDSVQYSFIQLSSSIFSLFFTFILFENVSASPENRIISIIISNFISVLLSFSLFYHRLNRRVLFGFRYHKLAFMYMFSFCTPLLINNFSSFFKGQFDRVLIAEQFSQKELGLYSAAFQIATIVLFFLMAVFRALEPYFFSKIKKDPKYINVVNGFVAKYSLLLFLPALFVSLVSEDLFTLILSDEFRNIKTFIIPFVLAFSINAVYFTYSIFLSFHGKTKILTVINLVSLAFYLSFLFLFSMLRIDLVPYATVISNVVISFLAFHFANKVCKMESYTREKS